MKKNYFGFYKEPEHIEPFFQMSRCFGCDTELMNFGMLVCVDCFDIQHKPKKLTHLPKSLSRK